MFDSRSSSATPGRRARAVVLALAAALLAAAPAAAERRPFAPPGTSPQYMPARSYDLLHRQLDLAFDWEAKSVSGTAVNRLTPLLAGTRSIDLHAASLDIARVTVDGAEAAWEDHPEARRIRVDLGRAVEPGEEIEVAVAYSARPRAGLYFVGPDEGYPDKPAQVWSQGESELNRHWFPRALAELGRPEALPVLDAIARGELDPQQRGTATAAAADLRHALGDGGDLARRIEELEREAARLRGELAQIKGGRE